MVSAPIPPVAFSPAPVVQQPVAAAELMAGGPVSMMFCGLQERLVAAFPSEKFQHSTLPPRLTMEAWQRFSTRTPAVGLGFVKLVPKPGASVRPRIWSGHAHWMIFLACRNPRVEAQLLGDDMGVGLAGMMAVATVALHGRLIGGIGSAEVGESGMTYSEGWADAGCAQAALSVTVPCDLIDAAGLSRLDDFLRMGERWAGLPDLVTNMRDDGVAAG